MYISHHMSSVLFVNVAKISVWCWCCGQRVFLMVMNCFIGKHLKKYLMKKQSGKVPIPNIVSIWAFFLSPSKVAILILELMICHDQFSKCFYDHYQIYSRVVDIDWKLLIIRVRLCSREGWFNARVICGQLENSLSYWVLHSPSERALNKKKGCGFLMEII